MIAVFEKRRNRKLSIQSKLEEIKAMSYKDNKMDRIKKKINEHYKN